MGPPWRTTLLTTWSQKITFDGVPEDSAYYVLDVRSYTRKTFFVLSKPKARLLFPALDSPRFMSLLHLAQCAHCRCQQYPLAAHSDVPYAGLAWRRRCESWAPRHCWFVLFSLSFSLLVAAKPSSASRPRWTSAPPTLWGIGARRRGQQTR